MLVFHGPALSKSIESRGVSAADAEVAKLRQTHPFQVVSEDGKSITYHRFPPQLALNSWYSMWIPGDPWQALATVIVTGRKNQDLREEVLKMMVGCKEITWSRCVEGSPAVELLRAFE